MSHSPSPYSIASEVHLQELMSQYAAGDDLAFDSIYQAAQPRLYGYLLRMTRDPARAEDLVQVTFAKLHRGKDRYQHGAPVMPWLFTIARNAFRDEHRGLRSRSEGVTGDGELPEVPVAPGTSELENREEIQLALMGVPENQRDAVVLTKFLGFSVAEAAELVDTTANSIKIRVHRGLRELRGYAWA